MSRFSRSLVRVMTVSGAAALLSVVLTGCGTGQVTQTSQKDSAVGGINANAGDIAIRDGHVAAPPRSTWDTGSTVPLSLYLSNLGTTTDRLVSVSSPVAATAAMVPEGAPLPSTQPSPVAGADSSTRAPGAAAGPAVPSAPTGWQPLVLSPGTVMMLSPDEAGAQPQPPSSAPDGAAQTVERPGYIVLTGITEQLRAGDQIAVTLRFEDAGQVTLELPISVPSTSRPRAPSEAEHAEH